MRNFQDTFETREQLLISALSICMTVPLKNLIYVLSHVKAIEKAKKDVAKSTSENNQWMGFIFAFLVDLQYASESSFSRIFFISVKDKRWLLLKMHSKHSLLWRLWPQRCFFLSLLGYRGPTCLGWEPMDRVKEI